MYIRCREPVSRHDLLEPFHWQGSSEVVPEVRPSVGQNRGQPRTGVAARHSLQAPPVTQRASMSKKHFIVCDALNYLSRFVPCDEASFRDATPQTLFAETHARVGEFAKAIALEEIEMVFIFDCGQTTDEAKQKWLERRKCEVELGERSMPSNAEVVLWSTLEQHGFQVYYPPGIDGDDAVARLAIEHNGSVLSRDTDMMRYGLPSGSILMDFAIRDCKITFLTRTYGGENISPRNVSQLRCVTEEWVATDSSLLMHARTGKLQHGNADGRTRTLGNLNILARPLRAAVYARHDLEPVLETMPDWADGKFCMDVALVNADNSLDGLLDDPPALLEWIRTHDVRANQGSTAASFASVCLNGSIEAAVAGWPSANRLHAAAMLAAGLHAAAIPNDPDQSTTRRMHEVYKTLCPYETRGVVAKKDWCAGAVCAGLHGSECVGDGVIFPVQVENAKRKKKPPMCQPCVSKLVRIMETRRNRKL